MKRVQLLVTGQLEQRSLATALGRLFPGCVWEPAQFVDSFTSCSLAAPPSGVRSTVEKAAQALVRAAFPGRSLREGPPDLVLLVDDLELANAPRPEAVTTLVRGAVEKVLADTHTQATRERAARAVRERASFHLLAPMVEAYFFAEQAALGRAGAGRASAFDRQACDVESFEVTTDGAYLAPPDEPRHPWRSPQRRRHPKQYLRYLCEPHSYRETKGGAQALATLAWGEVFHGEERAPYLRSLIADIAQALDVPSPFPGRCHPATRGPGEVLRNL